MKKIIALGLIIVLGFTFTGCGGTSQYDKDLQSGVKKMKSGEKMTESEKKATNDFLDWQSKQ